MLRAARWAVVAGAVLALSAAGPAAAQPLFSPTQDPLAGARVFGAKGCVRCHAVDGVGGTVGPDLGRRPRPRSFFDLGAAMWNHLPRMADRMRQLGIPRPRLEADEAADLIAFLFTLDYFDRPGDAATGRRLFSEKKCVVCHQAGGTGGVVGPSLDSLGARGSPIYVAAAMWNHGPAMAQAMRVRGIDRPTFREGELRDLVAYLRSAASGTAEGPLHVLPGRAVEGYRLFSEKRCRDCHGSGAAGPRGAPDLAARSVERSLTDFAAGMWNKAPAMLAAMTARGIPAPELRPEDMADIVAYLYAVRYFAVPGDARRGAGVARDKGCLACHTVHARDGKAPVDLARVTGLDSPARMVAALWNHSFVGAAPAARPPAAELRSAELADLLAFLWSVSGSR